MRFEKWEGLGNDFVLIESSAAAELPSALRAADGGLQPNIVQTLCDRHRGIGADGVLRLAMRQEQPPRLIIANADGSRPEMCGNGLRCVASYLLVQRQRSDERAEVVVQTDAGAKRCQVQPRGAEGFEVNVAMGRAQVGERFTVEQDQGAVDFVSVDIGNPHAVTFDAYGRQLADRLGPAVDASRPGGSNVELCRVGHGKRLDLIVWERGVGRTLACGTGACATAVAAIDQGLAPAARPLEVKLPGGSLHIMAKATAQKGRYEVQLRGPARRVFCGEIDL